MKVNIRVDNICYRFDPMGALKSYEHVKTRFSDLGEILQYTISVGTEDRTRVMWKVEMVMELPPESETIWRLKYKSDTCYEWRVVYHGS